MYLRILCPIICLISVVGVQAATFAQSESKTAARKVFETNEGKVFGIKALVKLDASMQGKQVINRELPAYGIGTVIAKDLLVASYRTIKPRPNIQGLGRAQAQGLKINTEVKEIKLIDGSGEEFDAKLVLHDEDLDLAFVALDRNGENAESWACEPVNISEDIELSHLDDAVFLSRAGESMRFQPSVRLGQVTTILKRPRKLYAMNTLVLGGAAFNIQGEYVGIGIRKKSGSGGEFSAILPSKYIRKLVPQAIEKANSVDSEAEEKTTDTEEPRKEKPAAESSEDQESNGGDVEKEDSGEDKK